MIFSRIKQIFQLGSLGEGSMLVFTGDQNGQRASLIPGISIHFAFWLYSRFQGIRAILCLHDPCEFHPEAMGITLADKLLSFHVILLASATWCKVHWGCITVALRRWCARSVARCLRIALGWLRHCCSMLLLRT